jgi:hypothetical protein
MLKFFLPLYHIIPVHTPHSLTYSTLHLDPQCKSSQNLGRGLRSHSQAMRATRVLPSWTTKVSCRPAACLVSLVGQFNFFRSEQEEIIQTLKKENDASDSKIRNFLDVLRLAFTLLSVPVIAVCSRSPLNSHTQTCHISLPKNKPTQPLSFTRSTSTDTLRHSIRIGSSNGPARHGGLRPILVHVLSRKSLCNHLSCTHVLCAYRKGFDQYCMVELRLCSGSFVPLLPFTHSPGGEKHIGAKGNEV